MLAEKPCRHCYVDKQHSSDPRYEGVNDARLASKNEEDYNVVHKSVINDPGLFKLAQDAATYINDSATKDDVAGGALLARKYNKKRNELLRLHLRPYSLQHVKPALWGLPFGAHAGGVNSATPPDTLHQLKLGLMKRAVKNIYTMLKGVSKKALFGKKKKGGKGKKDTAGKK